MGPLSATDHDPKYSTLEGGIKGTGGRAVEEIDEILEQIARVLGGQHRWKLRDPSMHTLYGMNGKYYTCTGLGPARP